jgi:NitT/TauT family transport system permease protein
MKLKKFLFPLTLLAALLGVWWSSVRWTKSVIFPTPLDVITGARELILDGTLWDHIAASLMRVGSGFALAVAVALPLGL